MSEPFSLQNYTHCIIGIIVVIFLLCIFYPPFNILTSNCQNNNSTPTPSIKSTEGFASWEIPSSDDIRTEAETCARKLAELTYNLVVYPCQQISGLSGISTCISGYNQYYE